MIKVSFFTFSKKRNSTAEPEASSATIIQCDLKGACSIMNPSLTLNLGTDNTPTYNFCYIWAFDRYYFIDDWTYYEGLWTCDLSIDVLGTYEYDIAQSSLYVLRSSKTYNDRLIDTTYPILYNSTNSIVELAIASASNFKCVVNGTDYTGAAYSIWNRTVLTSYVILGVTEEKYNGVTYYCMPYTTFMSVFKWLINSFPTEEESWVLDLGEAIKKAFYKPLSYITTCYLIPNSIPGISYDNHTISIGELEQTINTWNISNPLSLSTAIPTWYMRFDLPDHPQASTRGYWLDNAPYTDYTLDFLPFGVIPLPMAKLAGKTSIVCKLMLDIPTGNAELYIYTGTFDSMDNLIYHTSAKWGADLPYASTSFTTGTIGAMASAAAAVGGAAMSALNTGSEINALESPTQAIHTKGLGKGANLKRAMAIKDMKDNIGSYMADSAKEYASENIPGAIGNLAGSIDRVGGSAGVPGSTLAFFKSTPKLYAQFYTIADDDNAHRGKPLCQITRLGTLSPGFVKCNDGDIDISCTQDEKELIRNYLVGGFFFE